MAHDLARTENFVHFAGLTDSPTWHGEGQSLPRGVSMRDLATAAGINWEYNKTPVFFEIETMTDTFHRQYVGKSVLTVNGRDPLAVVSDDYEHMQPHEIVDDLDRLIRAGGWEAETAMALGQRETTCYCARLGQWSIDGDGSRLTDFLTVTDTVDAKHALTMFISTVRTVCRNTLNLGLRKASVRLELRHVAGHRMAYGQAVDEIVKSQNKVRETLVRLTKIGCDEKRLAKYLDQVFERPEGTGPQMVALQRRVLDLKEKARENTLKMVRVEGAAFTAWAAANGAVEAVQHGGIMPRLSSNMSLTLGSGRASTLVERAFEYAERIK